MLLLHTYLLTLQLDPYQYSMSSLRPTRAQWITQAREIYGKIQVYDLS